MSAKDMTNQRFGRIQVLSRVNNDKYGNAMWLCVCGYCGSKFVTTGSAIRGGHTRSCGCLQKSVASKLLRTHGMSRTRIFKNWAAMKQRCENPNNTAYKDYGAKGIFVCEEWHDFEKFYSWAISSGYSDGLTIDRKDNSKGYYPDNCRWATRAEQNRNTTRTHKIECNGRFITAAEASRMVNVSRSSVAEWCRSGRVSTIADVIKAEKEISDVKHLRRKQNA